MDAAEHLPRHLQRIWNGAPIDGQRVLIRCYHGLGDTLQFARFVPDVMDRAASVHLWAQPKLLELLSTMRPSPVLLPLHDGTPDVAFDVDLESMEVPDALQRPLLAPARELPYFHVNPGALAADRRPTVGLVWRAGVWDPRRSLTMRELHPLLDLHGIRWVIAQADAVDEECAHLPACRPDIERIVDHARVLRDLDLLITVDSMPAHLAGALAVETWLLLHSDPDWRWRTDEARIAYPTIRRFMQRTAGDWAPVIRTVRSELEALLHRRRSRP